MPRNKSLLKQDMKTKVEVWLYPKDQNHMNNILKTGQYTDMSDAVREALRKLSDEAVKAMTASEEAMKTAAAKAMAASGEAVKTAKAKKAPAEAKSAKAKKKAPAKASY